MGPMTEVKNHIDVCRKSLKDQDSRIRALALKRRVEDVEVSVLDSLRAEIELLIDDPDMNLKRAAMFKVNFISQTILSPAMLECLAIWQ
jgi:hypothetical protein